MGLILSEFAQVTGATLLVVAALFPIVNPLGSALLFLSLTRGYPHAIRSTLVTRISGNSFLLLVVSILIGSHVLAFFGVSIPVVQVAGGLVVFANGWTLLQEKSDPRPTSIDPDRAVQQAFYPLTLPLTVGPGSISVAIALGANSDRQAYPLPVLLASAFLGPLLIAISVYVSFHSAEWLERFLGEVGLTVLMRLFSFILICIGVQIFWNGVSALVHQL